MKIDQNAKKKLFDLFENVPHGRIELAPIAVKIGTSQSTLWNFIYGETKNFGKLSELLEVMGKDLNWLLEKPPKDSINFSLHSKSAGVIQNQVGYGPDTIPLLGKINASSSAVIINVDSEIGRTLRHPAQSGYKNVFAAQVVGDSMSPRHMDGEKVYLIADLMPIRGQDCIIELYNNEGFLKIFEKKTDKEIICRQLNPAKEWKRPLSEVKAIHAVVR